MGLTSEASFVSSPIFSCIASDISYSNDQTGCGISVSNHKKTIRIVSTWILSTELWHYLGYSCFFTAM